MPGAGASSITFWWRRCTEQSRSNKCTTLPWVSPNTCTSMWGGLARCFSISTRSRRKASAVLALVLAGHPRHAGVVHELLGRILEAHGAHGGGRRANEGDAVGGAGFGQFGA